MEEDVIIKPEAVWLEENAAEIEQDTELDIKPATLPVITIIKQEVDSPEHIDVSETLSEVKCEIKVEDHEIDSLNNCANDYNRQAIEQTEELEELEELGDSPLEVQTDIISDSPETDKEKCKICGEIFAFPYLLTKHMLKHTNIKSDRRGEVDKPCVCEICGKGFPRTSALVVHVRAHTQEKPFKCEQCAACFTQRSNLVTHLRKHTGELPFTCDLCGRRFKRKDALIIHVSAHTGIKPYKCEACGGEFSTRGRLTAHMKKHTVEGKVRCETCNKSVSRMSLPRHIAMHKKDQRYECTFCGSTFLEYNSLIEHRKSHVGEKPFKCDKCGKTFRQCNRLHLHMRTHTGERPFHCSYCEKAFNQKGHLKIHMKLHTGERPYSCKKCGKTFIQHTHLLSHCRSYGGAGCEKDLSKLKRGGAKGKDPADSASNSDTEDIKDILQQQQQNLHLENSPAVSENMYGSAEYEVILPGNVPDDLLNAPS